MLYNLQNPHGGDLYSQPVRLDYSANINPYGTPPGVLRAVTESLPLLCHYPDPQCRELVQAIADHTGLPEGYILCGSGAAELIFDFCAAEQPKRGLVTAPSFCEYETALLAQGCAVDRYMLGENEDFSLTEAFLPFLRAWEGDVLFLCNPNNPTGRVIERPLLGEILRICGEKKMRLFLDECFLDLTEGGETLSLMGALGENPQLLILKAFTKSYGMAGLRLGVCFSSDSGLLTRMARQTQPWNVSIPAQLAGVAALRETAFLRQAQECIHTQRQALTEGLRALGFRTVPSKTNFILFSSDLPLKERLLERGILIRSCSNYPGLTEGWFRIAVKRPEENRQLLAALEEIVYG